MNRTPAYLAELDGDRRIWGVFLEEIDTCSFYFIKDNTITDLHLTIEAVEGLRAIIEKLQIELALQNYSHVISTQGISPKKKPLAASKKAGSSKKTKKQPSAKKKKK